MRAARLGAGITTVPPLPAIDASAALMTDPVVPEDKRFCSACGTKVGRSQGDRPGRTTGFCPKCRQAFSFDPKLQPGDLVAGQYDVAGCLAHGGLGWIYLARDRNVSNRWVVLKGLLNTGDPDTLRATLGVHALVGSHDRRDESEDDGLDHALIHVRQLCKRGERRQIGAGGAVLQPDIEDISAGNADHRDQTIEEDRHEHDGKDTGYDEALDRIDAEHHHRVELFADAASAEVGRDRRTGRARDDQCRCDRRCLSHGGQHRCRSGK